MAGMTQYIALLRGINVGGHTVRMEPSSQGFLDAAIGKRTTTRFFHTAGKILKAAKEGLEA